MQRFFPGAIVKEVTTRNNLQAIIRYPKWSDLDLLTEYINQLSTENTFILFSGEKITRQQETEHLAQWFVQMESGDITVLIVQIDQKIVGIASVHRDKKSRARSLHVGGLGISLAKAYRGIGLGKILAETVIQEARTKISGLKQINLEAFANNKRAIELYSKLGFTKAGEIPNSVLHKEELVSKVLMYKVLNK